MKTRIDKILSLIVIVISILVCGHTAGAEPSLHDRLAQGEIVTDGGYQAKGVWAKMAGVVYAPPEFVWELFIQANNWKNYRIPHLTDSRAVNEEVANATASNPHVEDFFKALNGRDFDPMQGRKKSGVWYNYTFQYYDLPWPLANKWMVVKTKNDESRAAEHRFRGEWTKMAGNVRTVDGYIVIEPFEVPQMSLMTYYATSDPGSAVPKFLLKWGLKKTMPATMQAIRREADKVYGGKAPPLLKTQ